MSATQTISPRPLPPALKVAASVFAVAHLLVIGLYTLTAESGPWSYRGNLRMSPGPQFAEAIIWDAAFPAYLKPLCLMNDYHFASNRPAEFAVYFEVHLKYEHGDVKILRFPDEKANPWVRHRQQILAQHLAQDIPAPRPEPVQLDVVGEATPIVNIWVGEGKMTLRLTPKKDTDESLRQPGLLQPSPRAKALADSYTRYLCREHKAVSAQLVRYSRHTVMPMDMLRTVPPFSSQEPLEPDFFDELKSYFGEYRRDN